MISIISLLLFNSIMLNSVDRNRTRINFTAAPEVVAKLAKEGISRNCICASYIGYTGPKNVHFPITPKLAKQYYPDITEHYDALLKSALETTRSALGKNKLVNLYKKCRILCKNAKTADIWDTKFNENFPGRNKKGKVQYALLKGKVFSANQVSNYIYAELLFNLGFKKWEAIAAAKIYSQGAINLLFDKALPSVKALKFKDPPQDQQTIRMAYDELLQSKHTFA